MKKLTFILFILLYQLGFAQDIIIKNNGEEIKGFVKKITLTDIHYKKSVPGDTAVFSIPKKEVVMVLYQDGTKDIFIDRPDSSANNSHTIPTTTSHIEYGEDAIFNKNVNAIWYGVDFSLVKTNDKNIVSSRILFQEINNTIKKESKKFDLKPALRKHITDYAFEIVDTRNQAFDENSIYSLEEENPLEKTTLQNLINQYPVTPIANNLGVVFVAEFLNKKKANATYQVVIFDLASKKILLSDQVTGAALGSIAKNIWSNSLYISIQKIYDHKYNEWKAEFNKRNK
jgi:hypothetical protein